MILGTKRQALEEVLAETDKELAEVTRQMQALQERAESLKAERMGLQMALTRRVAKSQERKDRVIDSAVAVVEGVSTVAAGLSEAYLWRDLARTEAILRVMAEMNRPVSPTELSQMLRSRGRVDDSRDYVSAALAHLKKQKKVERAGYGLWILPSADSRKPLSLDAAERTMSSQAEGGGNEIEAHAG